MDGRATDSSIEGGRDDLGVGEFVGSGLVGEYVGHGDSGAGVGDAGLVGKCVGRDAGAGVG